MKVDFIDKMGSDLSVVNADRVSFEKRKEVQLKRTIYQKLAEIGIGRTAIIYAKK